MKIRNNIIITLTAFTCFISMATTALAGSASLNIGSGFRVDRLDWNIAAGSGTPNILSELKWKNIESATIESGLSFVSDGGYVFRVNGDYGWIVSGINQDSDFSGNNRTGEFSRSNNNAGSGNVWDVNIDLGYRFGDEAYLEPFVGWEIRKQSLRIFNGRQTLASAGTPPVGPIVGLDSSYNAKWTAPVVGVETGIEYGAWKFNAGFSYAVRTNYSADANWNLRTDLAHPVSFSHEGNGHGINVDASASYSLSDAWNIAAEFGYSKYWIRNGVDSTFSSTGAVSFTNLNEVNWESFSTVASLEYSF